ncbi:unnamed protein product [Linum trigynum]|uniref:Gnk2-homologous domain-containing protein n=1 Tax=Linum trigynum TaxID=586398 RepID=A0AAV2E290_9ROSI
MPSFVPKVISPTLLMMMILLARMITVVVKSDFDGDYEYAWCSGDEKIDYSANELAAKEWTLQKARYGAAAVRRGLKQHCECSPADEVTGTFWCAYAFCTSSLSGNDCRRCTDHAEKFLWPACDGLDGGQWALKDCFLRYETHPFC